MTTWLLAVLAFSSTADAGFYKKDRYDPPGPRLGGLDMRQQLHVGPHWTRSVYGRTTRRVSLAYDTQALFMVAPFVELGGRIGGQYTSARQEAVSNEEEWTGYRTFSVYVDPMVAVGGNWGRVYAFGSLVQPARLYGLSGSEWPRQSATMQHFGAGIELLWGGGLSPTDGDSGGVQIELRQTRMAIREPVDFLPSAAVGHTLFVSFVGFTYGGGR